MATIVIDENHPADDKVRPLILDGHEVILTNQSFHETKYRDCLMIEVGAVLKDLEPPEEGKKMTPEGHIVSEKPAWSTKLGDSDFTKGDIANVHDLLSPPPIKKD